MICTCSYENFNNDELKTCSVSFNHGKDVKYSGPVFEKLVPKKVIYKMWKKKNKNQSQLDANKQFIKNYYNNTLYSLDPINIFHQLDKHVILCHGNNDEFSTRHIIAAWLELMLEENIFEVKVNGKDIDILDKPSYIKEELESIIRSTYDMHGFNSIKAAYLFNEGKRLDQQADEIFSKSGKEFEPYRQSAQCFYDEAGKVEVEYKKMHQVLTKKNDEND